MSLDLQWIMKVAVISTAHMPQGWEPGDLYHFKVNGLVNDAGPIVYIDDLDGRAPDWLVALAAALKGYEWVRFDSSADVIEGLATFEWD